MRLTIGKKLGLGFATVLALMILSAVIVSLSIRQMNRSVEVVTKCDLILNGLNNSMAATRGFIILGDDEKQATFFRSERQEAWKNIDRGLKDISKFYVQASRDEDAANYSLVTTNIEPFRKAQDQVEKIAHTVDNVPSQKILLEEAAPLASKILDSITIMIDAEVTLESTEERKQLLKTLADFRSSFAQCLGDIRGYLLSGEILFKDEFDEDWQENQTAYAAIVEKTSLLMARQGEVWTELRQQRETFRPLATKMFTLRSGAQWNQANYLLQTEAVPAGVVVRDALEELKSNARDDVDSAQATLASTLIVTTLLATVLGAAIAVVLSRRMSTSVRSLLERVQEVASGDLRGESVRITSQDELGELSKGVNQMVRSLRDILAETTVSTGEVAAASSEIATGVQQQLSSLNQTATSLNQITATAEEFKATMREFADRARAVQEAADETTRQTADGRELTQDSAARIEQVRVNAQTAGASVLKLSEQMQRIGEITATVNEIAEQTKLLALNASIEAARAGEDGRGFAVVATQVRELANQSKESAGRIESLIGDTQKSMQVVVAKIEEGGRLSEDSVESVQQMARAFEEIAQAISQTREAMSQINIGARQQEEGIVELVSSITEIDSGSRESVAAAEQTQKAIVAIDQRIQSLNESVERFKT